MAMRASAIATTVCAVSRSPSATPTATGINAARRDDAHGPDRERAIEQGDAAAPGQAGQPAPRKIAHLRRGSGQKDDRRGKQREPRRLRNDYDRDDVGPLCGEAAEKVSGAVRESREECEDRREHRDALASPTGPNGFQPTRT